MSFNTDKFRKDLRKVAKNVPFWILGGAIGFYGPSVLVNWNPLGLQEPDPFLFIAYVFGGLFSILGAMILVLLYFKFRDRYMEEDR